MISFNNKRNLCVIKSQPRTQLHGTGIGKAGCLLPCEDDLQDGSVHCSLGISELYPQNASGSRHTLHCPLHGSRSTGAWGRWYSQGEMVWGGGGCTYLRFVEFKFQAMLAHLGRSVFPNKRVEQETNEIKYRCGSVGVIHIGGNPCPSNRVVSNVLSVKEINLLFEIWGEELLLETLLSKKTSSWRSDWQAAPHHHLLDMMSGFEIKKQRGKEQLVRACAGSTSL